MIVIQNTSMYKDRHVFFFYIIKRKTKHLVKMKKRIIICGKAGSGKDFLKEAFRRSGLTCDVSVTTRPIRHGEIEGQSYHYTSSKEFARMESEGLFKECLCFNEWRYGMTNDSWENSQVFILAPSGIKQLDDLSDSYVIFLDIAKRIRVDRMNKRSDANSVSRRLLADEADFSEFGLFDKCVTDEEFDADALVKEVSTLVVKRVRVLDQGFVELIDMMPHPSLGVSADLAVVNAARVSFLGESKGNEADKKLLFYLMRNGHSSPFEMVHFKFRIRAPVVVFWHWVRHRTFHFMNTNSQSGRYTPFEEDDFYRPGSWRKQSCSNKQGSEGVVENDLNEELDTKLADFYKLSHSLYKDALEKGVSKEMARLFLPGFAVYYTWIINVDAHNLMHWIKLRMAKDAQYEIRVYAEAIYQHFFKPLMPWTSEAFEQHVLNKS